MKNKIKRAFAAVGIVAGAFGVTAGVILFIIYAGELVALIALALLFAAAVCLTYRALRDGWDD